MSSSVEVVYLDDMCYIGWLNSVQGSGRSIVTAEQIAHITGVLEDVRLGKRHLVLSALHRTTVEELYGGDGGFFEKLRRWEHTFEYVPSRHDYSFAGELRERTREEHERRVADKTHKLGQSDSLHIACAIATKCDSFLTHEPKLIRLYEEQVIPEVKICAPSSDYLPFDFGDIPSLGAQYQDERDTTNIEE